MVKEWWEEEEDGKRKEEWRQEEWKGRVKKSKLLWRLEHSSLPSSEDDR